MGEVTKAEFDQLRAQVEEIYWMTRGLMQVLVGKEKTKSYAEYVKDYRSESVRSERFGRMFSKPDGLVAAKVPQPALEALFEQDCVTVQEVALRPRREIARITGVGRVALARLDAALAERGLTWVEAA
jgi:hypothetical protein